MDDVLPTERLVLRPLVPEDAPTIASYRGDPEVARHQSWEAGYTEAQAARLVADVAGHQVGGLGWAQLGITLADDGELIGDVGVDGRRDGTAAVGYTLARAHWGLGYATEAVGAVVEHLLGAGGKAAVTADVEPANTASIAVVRKLGFVLVGTDPYGVGRYRRDRGEPSPTVTA